MLAKHHLPAGNLSSRQDLNQGLTESFTYDALDRLTLATGPGAQSLSVSYDAIGNVVNRSDVGAYTYDPLRKHAVTVAGSSSFSYDANGNMITRNGSSVSWTSGNQAFSLSAVGYSAQFSYAPDRSRWQQISTYAGGTEVTVYAGGLFEKLTTAVRTHYKSLVPVPSGLIEVIRRSDGSSDTFYITTDHLGSSDAVVDGSGTVVARLSFAAFGGRRSSTWQGAPSPAEWQAIANTSRRGFTGHEELDNVLLVHMGGRVYDPGVGRFLSADPYVDGVDTTQGWNRYAYVDNGPLSATDPSGFEESDGAWNVVAVGVGMTLEEIVVTAGSLGDPRARSNLSDMENLANIRGLLHTPSAGLPTGEDGVEQIIVTATRIHTPGSATPPAQGMPQGDPCSASLASADEFREPSLMGFLKEEGLNVLSRTADVVGGTGMVLAGGAACATGLGCAGGAPLATLGLSSIQEGWTGEAGFVRSAATSAFGTTAGNVTTDVLNVGVSVTGLFHATLRPGTWRLFRDISSDFVPAYQTMTRTGLSVEIGGTALGAASVGCRYMGK